jgi:hypothetical protein
MEESVTMKEETETSGIRRPSLPEVAVLQENCGAAEEINFSVVERIPPRRENEITTDITQRLADILLRCPLECQTVIQDAISEIAILRERESIRFVDGVETLNTALKTLRAVQPGKAANAFFRDSEGKIRDAAPEDKPLIINARIKAACTMIKNSPPTVSVSMGTGQFHYNTKTRTENRGLALVDYLRRTGKSSIPMPEARTILETIEGRRLDRTIVWRALRFAQGFLRASLSLIGGVGRLVLDGPLTTPATQVHGAILDEEQDPRDNAPRPRRDRVPWAGAD